MMVAPSDTIQSQFFGLLARNGKAKTLGQMKLCESIQQALCNVFKSSLLFNKPSQIPGLDVSLPMPRKLEPTNQGGTCWA